MIIAIDPGTSGGVAWWQLATNTVAAIKMPSTIVDLKELIEEIVEPELIDVYVENVGQYRAGNSGPAASMFAGHCGEIRGLLVGMGIRQEKVAPQTWMKAIPSMPKFPAIPKSIKGKERDKILSKRKRIRKNHIKNEMQKVYPHIKITLATSDALGILYWASKKKSLK